jgi:hypothetical protein
MGTKVFKSKTVKYPQKNGQINDGRSTLLAL